jgi:transcriptional regulator with XRE-family HTH domain
VGTIRFGEYLAQILREQECSGSRLAAALGVDAALVYRWLRNEAVPKLDTAYCDEIARTLHLSQTELSRLKEAQVFSLSRPLERRSKPRSSAAVERLLRRRAPHARSNGSDALALPAQPPPAPRPSGVIWGRPAVLQATINLLENLPVLPRLQSHPVMLSFQGAENAFDDFPELQEQFITALQGALQRGWQVCHLWRLDEDVRRSILLVEEMLKLLGTGRYLPCYMSQYGTLAPPYDLLIVPKTAAMLLFATQNPRRDDAALLTHDPEQIELLSTHFGQLCALSQPLARSYTSVDRDTAWEAYTEAESHPGGRMAVKDGLTFLTEPPAWYQEDWPALHFIGLSDQAYSRIIESQQRRRAAFQTHVANFPYHDICPRHAIERLVSGGETNRNDRMFGIQLSRAERREHLEYTLFLLKTYEQYQLALIDAEEEQAIPTEMFWEVAGKRTVVLNAWATDTHGKDVFIDVVINEPTIAHAFHDYFEELWDRIAPAHKDKAQVIVWLEQQLALFNAAAS